MNDFISTQSCRFICQKRTKVSSNIMNGYAIEFIHKFFAESSVHCFPYVARRDFHLIERIFWLVIIVLSSCYAHSVFSDQWLRYNENPTVLSIEILSEGDFERPSFTVCTNFTNLSRASEIVEA